MTTRTARWSIALTVALVATPALAEQEDVAAHAKATTQTITLDGKDVRPSRTTMSHADVIAFVNYSTHPVEIAFNEPADLEKRIRCGLVKGKESEAPAAPWALFSWQDGKLVGNVPPGRFASVCAFDPGSYSFTASPIGVGHRATGLGGILPAKGQIVVK